MTTNNCHYLFLWQQITIILCILTTVIKCHEFNIIWHFFLFKDMLIVIVFIKSNVIISILVTSTKCYKFVYYNVFLLSRICQSWHNFYKIKCDCFNIDDSYKMSRISSLTFFFCHIFLNYYTFFTIKYIFYSSWPLYHYTNQFNHRVVLIHHTDMKTMSQHFNIYTLLYTL